MRRVCGIAALAVLALAFSSLAPGAALAQAPAKPAPMTNTLFPVTYTIEQLQTAPLSAELQKQLGPLNTIAEVEALLKANKLPFAWRIVDVASESMPVELSTQLANLKPNDVFVIPSPTGAVIGSILNRR